jgi:glutamate 5-kinase
MPKTPSLKNFRRIVIKVGSSLLATSAEAVLKRQLARALRSR